MHVSSDCFKRRVFQAGVCLILLSIAAGCGNDPEKKKAQPDRIYTVTRGSFNVVISANGALDAIKRYRIEAPPAGRQG
ncbi:MAG: hypothetical protein PHP93_02240, partial [Kiritimatiellales bacterium]|nr:hypothetical protein [Kiritimatiellales bacterium]